MTLVEVGTSVAVVAISLLGTAAAVATSAAVESSTAETQTAKRAVGSLMDDIRATDFAALVDTYDGTSHTLHGFGAGGDEGTASVRIREVDNGSSSWIVYRVSVRAAFPGSSAAEAREIVTYVSDRRRGSALSSAPVVVGGEETTTTETTQDTTTQDTTTTDTTTDGVTTDATR